MEIKILCPCGTKFSFDVEPVNFRMPAPVACPACGADATEQANSILREKSSPSQSTAAPAPPSSPPGPAPTPAGLRITRHATPTTQTLSAEGPQPEPPPPRPLPFRPEPTLKEEESTSPLVKALATIALLALIGFGLWKFGHKWYKRLDLVAKVATAVAEAGVDQGGADSEGARNLWYDNCAMLFVKHTNQMEIAEVCRAFWNEKLHKRLTVLNTAQDAEGPGEYELMAPHHGWVRILGSHEWPVPQHEALVQYLSQKYSTLVFEWRSESFADTYHFGVYDQGTRKFHAQMDIKMTQNDEKEVVTMEGNDYAKSIGYKPGKEGYKDFSVLDADKITRLLGMKLWDESEGTEMKGMLLKETGPAP
jgi:hypothetical protein